MTINGLRAFQLQNKLANVRKQFIKWNKEVFGRIEKKIRTKQQLLQNLQDSIHILEGVRREEELREDLEDLLIKEEIKWTQKARCDWVVQGDRNTKYFQTVAKQRKAKNKIVSLRKDDGTLTKNFEEIESIMVSHFKNRFTETNPKSVQWILGELEQLPIPKLTHQQLIQLEQPLTDLEIELAIFQLGPHKSPGLDGIPAFFYQEYWSIVKQDILNSAHAFFHSGSMLKALNKTFITLILKVMMLEEVSQFRSISLCNVTYNVKTYMVYMLRTYVKFFIVTG